MVQGTVAAEILSACDERMEVMTRLDHMTNPTISITQALKRANLATFKNFAQQQLQKVRQARATPNPTSYASTVSVVSGRRYYTVCVCVCVCVS